MRLPPRAIAPVAAFVTVAVWTAFIVIARASAGRTLGPLDLAFCRIVGAALVLLPWGYMIVRREGVGSWLGLSPLSARLTAVTGFFGGLVYAMLAYSGFYFAPAVHASVLMPGSLPLWTTLLATLVLGERLTRGRVLGLACIVAGDLFVGGASLLHAFQGGTVWKGDLLFMAAAFTWATYSVLARRHRLDAVRATIAVIVFAFFTYVPAFVLLTGAGAIETHLMAAPWGDIAFQTVFQGLGSVVISGIGFTKMLEHYGPVRSTMMTALVPGLSALGAVVFLGEPLHWPLLVGLALVTLGIVFGVRRAAARAPVLCADEVPAR